MTSANPSVLVEEPWPTRDNESQSRRILVVCHAWYGDLIGGSFRLATEFAVDMAAAGHDVHYICCQPNASTPLNEVEGIDRVTVHRYPVPSDGTGGWGRMRHHINATRDQTLGLIRERPFDVIHGHSPLQFAGAVKAIGAESHSVYVVHSPFADELRSNLVRQSIRGRAAELIASRIEKGNLRAADCVQTLSRYTLGRLRSLYPGVVHGQAHVAPGWVDAERFRSKTSQEELRASLGDEWTADVPILFTLRRLEARMGLETLIDAAAKLLSAGRRFKLLIGGGGSLFSKLGERLDSFGITDNVKLLGRLDEDSLPMCYAAADCFVLPTTALECFGLIVLESFAAGTPVVASRAAAIPELASIQGDEWLFEPGNVADLAACLNKFLDGQLTPHPSLHLVAEQYDRKRMVACWEQIALNPS